MHPAAITSALRRTDFLRRARPPGPRKEWLHFCVHAAQAEVMVNLSVSDRPTGRDPDGRAEVARLVMLADDGRRRVAGVDTFGVGDFHAPAGGLAFALGGSALDLRGDAFSLRASLRDEPVALDVVLRPRALPAVIPRLPLGDAPPLDWVIVPRLDATGTLTVDGRATPLAAALAYHDHNWGRFRWGDDFAWEWGFALPDTPGSPWTLVFARLTDRARLVTRAQALMLWRGSVQHRLFRNEAVAVHRDGYLAAGDVLRVPRVMGLVCDDGATDVPRRFRASARERRDEVGFVFAPSAVAQVAVPNDADLGVTRIHEVSGRVSLRGAVRGERVELEGRGFFEFLEG